MKKPATTPPLVTPENQEFLLWVKDAPDEVLVTRKQATVILCMDSERFLEDAARKGSGPPMVRISARAIRYKLGDLRRWIASKTVTHTSQEVSA